MMNREQAVRQMEKLIKTQEQSQKSVKRKRSLRPSEKAVWLAEFSMNIEALKFAIVAVDLAAKAELERMTKNTLVDAAPDLLEALQWVGGHGYSGGKSFKDVPIVRNALSKAGAT